MSADTLETLRWLVGAVLSGFLIGRALSLVKEWHKERRVNLRKLFVLTTLVVIWAAVVTWQYA